MPTRVQWDGSGEACEKKECINCDMKPAKGIYFKRAVDGREMFICDNCGYKDAQGWDIAHHEIMVKAKEDYQHAFDNRDRWRRENNEKFSADWERAYGNLKPLPDGVENFMRVMKPDFDSAAPKEDNVTDD